MLVCKPGSKKSGASCLLVVRQNYKLQKSGRTDLVTNIDKQVEKYLVTQIKQTFPGSRVLGEEGDRDQDPQPIRG